MKVLILVLIGFTQLAFTADGNLNFVKGKVLINGKVVTTGTPLNYGDKIAVGNKSYAVLSINPGTIIKLKPKTKLKLAQPKINTKKGFNVYSYLLSQGDMFIRAKRTKKNRYKVKTKNAILGVRGTTFFVSTAKGKKNIWMCVNEGKVSVKASGKTKSVLVKAGEGVVIDSDKAPEVKQYAWTKELNWKFQGDLKEIKDTTNIQEINYDLENFDYD